MCCAYPTLPVEFCRLNNLNTLYGRWYEWWEKAGFFVADPKSKQAPFVIVRLALWNLFFLSSLVGFNVLLVAGQLFFLSCLTLVC